MTERQDIIKITGLKKSFGDLHVLKGIDLYIKEKEVVVIIGPSGSGKSTLLRCINSLHQLPGRAFGRGDCVRQHPSERGSKHQ